MLAIRLPTPYPAPSRSASHEFDLSWYFRNWPLALFILICPALAGYATAVVVIDNNGRRRFRFRAGNFACRALSKHFGSGCWVRPGTLTNDNRPSVLVGLRAVACFSNRWKIAG